VQLEKGGRWLKLANVLELTNQGEKVIRGENLQANRCRRTVDKISKKPRMRTTIQASSITSDTDRAGKV
jgi:predicted ABC-class ATPase